MQLDRTNGGPGCSSMEGFLQENGVRARTVVIFYLLLTYQVGTANLLGLWPSARNPKSVQLDQSL